jgi:YhcG PDDEXK nuclease domain
VIRTANRGLGPAFAFVGWQAHFDFVVAVVGDRLRSGDKHQPTVGILVVAGKNETVVRYALASTTRPIAVSRYELTEDAQRALPATRTSSRAFADELTRERHDTTA